MRTTVFVLLLLAALLPAQLHVGFEWRSPGGAKHTVTLEGDAKVSHVDSGGLRASIWKTPIGYRLTLRNRGTPNVRWAVPTPTTGQRVEIRDAGCAIPATMKVLWHEFLQADNVYSLATYEIWSLWQSGGEKAPDLGYTGNHHTLRGGEAVSWDIVDDAFMGFHPKDDEVAARIKAFTESPSAIDAGKWPHLSKLQRMFSAKFSKYAQAPPDADRDFAWWTFYSWTRRWSPPLPTDPIGHPGYAAGQSGHPWRPDNWMQLGAVMWGEGHSNGHYDPTEQCVINYVTTGDGTAFDLAYLQAVHHVTRGLVVTDAPNAAFVNGLSWFEKGPWRPGNFQGGSVETSHQWHSGVICVAALTKDPHLMALVKVIRDRLINTAPNWYRRWGIRRVAWALKDLHCLYVVNQDAKALSTAVTHLRGVLNQLQPTEMWFPNDGSGQMDAWQSALTLYFAYRVLESAQAVGLVVDAERARIEGMIRWHVDHCIRTVDNQHGTYPQVVEGGIPDQPSSWKWVAQPTKLGYYYRMLATAAYRMDYAPAQAFAPVVARAAAEHFMQNTAGVVNQTPMPLSQVNWTDAGIGTANTKILLGVAQGLRSGLLR